VADYQANAAARTSFLIASAHFDTGEDTPRAYLERCIATIKTRESTVQAFASMDLAAARDAADLSTQRWSDGDPLSLLDGCPVGVKDIIHTRELPTEMGSELYKDWQAPEDALGVAALRAAGALILGKTATVEFALGRAPTTTNPWDSSRTAGGSSSGSCAAVGAGMLPLTLGTQTVGSILRPCSFCAAVGYKPSLGVLSTTGLHPLSQTMDHLGPIAATSSEAWLAAQIMQSTFAGAGANNVTWLDGGADAVTPSRLARVRVQGDSDLDAQSAQAFEEYLTVLRQRGVDIVDAQSDERLGELDLFLDEANELCMNIVRYEIRYPLSLYVQRAPDAIGSRIHGLLAEAAKLTAADYRNNLAARAQLRDKVARIAIDVDGFILPSASGPAPLGLEFTGKRTMLAPWSLIGGPAWSLPLLAVAGLPFGVQVAGAPGDDVAIAGVAHWLMGE
jgi:Asp-tRNA(Asn)/Glu-tRNA(Gln) amidotransferase A subunit family amidase